MSLQLANFLSLTGVATTALPLIGAIISPNNTMRYIIVSVVLFAVIVGSKILKQLIKNPRPVAAMNCGVFNSGGSAKDEFGMPSGHMAVTSFMIFSTLLISTKNPVIWSLGIAWLASVGWARYAKHCHSLAQIIGGTVYGTSIALLLYSLTP
jgi:membrane-associated phospholipid phosphatase